MSGFNVCDIFLLSSLSLFFFLSYASFASDCGGLLYSLCAFGCCGEIAFMKAAAVMRDHHFITRTDFARLLAVLLLLLLLLHQGDGCDCTAGNEAGASCSVVLCPLAQSVLTPTLQTCGQTPPLLPGRTPHTGCSGQLLTHVEDF